MHLLTNLKTVYDLSIIVRSLGVSLGHAANARPVATIEKWATGRVMRRLVLGVRELKYGVTGDTRLTDRRTEFPSLDRVCIPCSAVKMEQGKVALAYCHLIYSLAMFVVLFSLAVYAGYGDAMLLDCR